MPPRWPRKPTRQDPEFRKLDDRYSLAFHIAVYLTTSTGLTFFYLLFRAEWSWLIPMLGWWGLSLGLHTLWILGIAKYPPLSTELETPEPVASVTDQDSA